MEFNEVLQTRRSIRSYTGEALCHETLEEIVKLAQFAPSWKNQQTTRYYVLESKQALDQMREEGLAPFNAQRTMKASNYIIITFVKDVVGYNEDGTPTNELGNGWGCFDAGIACQSLILAAKDKGVGTLIMGIRDAQKIKELYDIPENEVVTAVVSLGYADKEPSINPRKDISEQVRYK
ncbi:MAG: nitroreductase family protein [Holdemanella sp.]|nr:nitroreductase family protein [Holdemanella sp.]